MLPKLCKCLLITAGCLLYGCVSGPLPSKEAWPWGHDRDYDKRQTGGYLAVTGNVAQFGAPPTASRPVDAEALENQPGPESSTETAIKKSDVPVISSGSKPDSGETVGKGGGKYLFSVTDVKPVPPSYLPVSSVESHDITASNRGEAPVSVAVVLDQSSSQNVATDKPLPLVAVLPAGTVEPLFRLKPKVRNGAFGFKYRYSWSIGDYRAVHRCTEHYRFPFPDNVTASVIASDDSTPFTRNTVTFLLPQQTPIFPARKGIVVQIRKDDEVDILHDDSTIGTYSHFGKIADDVIVGKVVSTNDVIGLAGGIGNKKDGYLEVTVWRPELTATASPQIAQGQIGFDFLSFPLEFCSTGSSECKTLHQGQVVSRNMVRTKISTSKHPATVR